MQKFDTDNAADRGFLRELSHVASEIKKAPQATRPSSRVKKIVKEGRPNFVGPKQNEAIKGYIPEYEGSEKFAGPYSGYNEPEYRSKTEGQKYHRALQQQESKKGRRKEYTSERKRQFRLQRAGIRSDFGGDKGRPLKADDIYYKLRENLSPANQRLLDILTRNTKEDRDIPF